MNEVPTIGRSDVTYLWHANYYDGPLSGVCEWRGRRYWFVCVDEGFRPTVGGDFDEPEWARFRQFHLVELTPDEWAAEDARHALFRRCVGAHADYDRATQRRSLDAAVNPQSEWSRYYDTYPPNKANDRLTPPAHGRPAAAKYED